MYMYNRCACEHIKAKGKLVRCMSKILCEYTREMRKEVKREGVKKVDV